MRIEFAPSCPVSIFIAGDYDTARDLCSAFCGRMGLCVTVTETSYIYTGGEEAGVVVGLINYPRFPSDADNIQAVAEELAMILRDGLGQESFTIQTPTNTAWFSWREADLALAAATSGGDAKQAPCEASQSGGSASERNAQPSPQPSGDTSNE
jgi:hypothetical protein